MIFELGCHDEPEGALKKALSIANALGAVSMRIQLEVNIAQLESEASRLRRGARAL